MAKGIETILKKRQGNTVAVRGRKKHERRAPKSYDTFLQKVA